MDSLVAGFLGLIYGWILGSLIESFFHQHLGHTNAKLRKFFTKIPVIGKQFRSANEAHSIVHHSLTYQQDHTTQFSNKNPMTMVDAKIIKKGILDLDDLKSEQYGLSLNLIGFIKFSIPFLIIWFVLFIFINQIFILNSIFLYSSLGMMFVAPAFSTWLHPVLHSTYEEGIKQAMWPFSWILNSRYGRFLWDYHELHHRNRNVNFNLMLGGDFLRGCAKLPEN
jgi:hypothetical protein